MDEDDSVPDAASAPDPAKANVCKECSPDYNPDSAACQGCRGGSSHSAEPVRYSNGEISLVTADLSYKSFGLEWGHTRSYSNRVTQPDVGRNGNGWFVKEWPILVPIDPDPEDPNTPATICLIWVIQEALWFDYNSTSGKYVARFYSRPKLEYDAANEQFTLTDSAGRVTKFFDFSPSQSELKKGHFKSFTDAAGRETVASYNEDIDLIESFVQSYDDYSSGYYYNYLDEGYGVRLGEVHYELNGEPVRKVAYSYYGAPGNTKHGSAGDLERATISQYNGSEWEEISSTYYRYYKENAEGKVAHGLRFVLSPLGYQQMVEKGITPETATNGQIADFAKHEFRYDHTDRSVTEETVNSGTATYGFDRVASGFADNSNHWKYKTVEDLPDGNRQVVYTNSAGQMLLKVFIAMVGGEPTNQRWYECKKYDDAGRTLQEVESSAVAGYDEEEPELVTLKANQGLIRVFVYYGASPGTGGAPNRLQYEKVKKGEFGTPVTIREWQYVGRTVGSQTIYFPWKDIEYRSSASGGSDPVTTEYSYLWNHFQVVEKTTTLPVVTTQQNGSGVANQVVEAFDDFGHLLWRKNARGYIDGFTYDLATDALVQKTEDVAGGAPWEALPTPPAHLNLITSYEVDDHGRVVQELGPAHKIDLDGTATMVRRATWTIYLDATFQRWQATGFQKTEDESFTLINPVHVLRFDAVNRLVDDIQAVREDTDGPLTAADVFLQDSWVRWAYSDYGRFAEVAHQRVYFKIPDEHFGNRHSNYNQSDYSYDIMQRRVRERSPGGTITRYVYHPMGWILEKWIGTDDTGASQTNPAGWGSSLNNMVKVEAYEYDRGRAGQDRNQTKMVRYLDEHDENARVTVYGYDWRNRRTSTDGEIDFFKSYTYDNLDRQTKTDQHDTDAEGHLVRRNIIRYDNRGRIFCRLRYGVDPATGTEGNALKDDTWYDPSGNILKNRPAGSRSFKKFAYDALNRQILKYVALDPDESGYAAAGSVTDDTVIEQTETQLNAAGEVIFVTQRSRAHNASGTGKLLEPTGMQPQAWVNYTGYWPGTWEESEDEEYLVRVDVATDYGTNAGSTPTRPDLAPTGSDDLLVTTDVYNDRGERFEMRDPAGRVQATTLDDAGRKIKVITNAMEGGTNFDQNQTTLFAYSPDGLLATMTVQNSETKDQVTKWVYGSSSSDSSVASSLLLRQKIYPHALGHSLQFAYNRAGQQVTMTDQREVNHAYVYDKLGRLLHDAVTLPPLSTVDSSVLRLSYEYDVRGLTVAITSYDAGSPSSGNVVNQVLNSYDSYEQLLIQQQSHHLAVTSTSPKVQYTYADGSANSIRRTKMSYPDSRELNYSYGVAAGIDDELSRVSDLIDDDGTTHLASYSYVGARNFAIVEYPETGISLSYANSLGTAYPGWDRFGRIIDQNWAKSGTAVERLQYGYDRNSNRVFRKNVLASAGHDEIYTYDGLNQLITLKRGTLDTGNTSFTGPPSSEEDFTFDPTGNWDNYTTKTNGTTTLAQDRTHNVNNEISAISGASDHIGYDLVGNMIKTPRPGNWSAMYRLTWDAWNRLMRVDTVSATVASYAYDALTRRVTITDSSSVVRHCYYSDRWNILEERVGFGINPERQFVWGEQRLDDLVLRDRSTSPAERLYSLSDPLNVTAIANNVGIIMERYEYSAFGITKYLDASFSGIPASTVSWETNFGGYRLDTDTKLNQVRFRYLHSRLGRWLSEDPYLLPYNTSFQNFVYAGNNPKTSLDPDGLKVSVRKPMTECDHYVQCCKGRLIVHLGIITDPKCNQAPYQKNGDLRDCIIEHEQLHLSDYLKENPNICVGQADGTPLGYDDDEELRQAECRGTEVQYHCLQRKVLKHSFPTPALKAQCEDGFASINSQRHDNNCKPFRSPC